MNIDWDGCARALALVLSDTVQGLEVDHGWLTARSALLDQALVGRAGREPTRELRRRFHSWSGRRAFLLCPAFAHVCDALGTNAGVWRKYAAGWLHLPVNGRLLREALNAHARR